MHQSKKKTSGYQERDEAKRAAFRTQLKTKPAGTLVYVDEAGIDNRDDYPYGYSPIGQRFYAAVFCGGIIPPQTNLLKLGKRTERVSWITALKQGKLFAPMTNATARVTEICLRCGYKNVYYRSCNPEMQLLSTMRVFIVLKQLRKW